MRTILGITGIYTLLALGAVLANPNEWVWPLFLGCREPFRALARLSK